VADLISQVRCLLQKDDATTEAGATEQSRAAGAGS